MTKQPHKLSDTMNKKIISLTDTLHHYVLENSLREPAGLKALREITQDLTGAQMQIPPEQGQFMALLVKLMQAELILELGTFTGYSAAIMALALPPNGKLITCDINSQSSDLAKTHWQKIEVDKKIELRLGPALETLDDLLLKKNNVFDLAFIDADKQSYAAYYEKVLLLLRPGGLMILDNTLQQGHVADSENTDSNVVSIRALNKKILSDTRVELSLLPVVDGITLVYKK